MQNETTDTLKEMRGHLLVLVQAYAFPSDPFAALCDAVEGAAHACAAFSLAMRSCTAEAETVAGRLTRQKPPPRSHAYPIRRRKKGSCI